MKRKLVFKTCGYKWRSQSELSKEKVMMRKEKQRPVEVGKFCKINQRLLKAIEGFIKMAIVLIQCVKENNSWMNKEMWRKFLKSRKG